MNSCKDNCVDDLKWDTTEFHKYRNNRNKPNLTQNQIKIKEKKYKMYFYEYLEKYTIVV